MRRTGSLSRIARTALLTAVCALATACATRLPPPGLDFAQAGLVGDPTAPALSIDGLPGGKAAGAGVGAATGAGSGVLAGAAACLATGPFFPLCIATVVPTTLAVGAVTGAAVGASRSEGSDARDLKRELMVAELASTSYQALLVEQMQKQAHSDYATPLALLPTPAAAAPAASASSAPGDAARNLRIEVALTEVGTEGKSEFALRVVARLKVYRQGEAAPLYDTGKEVQSETELTTAEWSADGGRALRGILSRCVQQAAHNLLGDLIQPPGGARGTTRGNAGSKYSTSCEDVPKDWKPSARISVDARPDRLAGCPADLSRTKPADAFSPARRTRRATAAAPGRARSARSPRQAPPSA